MNENLRELSTPKIGGPKSKTLEEITNEEMDNLIDAVQKSTQAVAKMQQRVNDAKANNESQEEIARLEALVKLHTDYKQRLSSLKVEDLAQAKFEKQNGGIKK